MGTQIFKFKGIAMWAKVHNPDAKYERYCVDAFLTDKSWELFKKSRLQLERKEGKYTDAAGVEAVGEYVRFGRPIQKLFGKELVEFGPVVVKNAQGQKIDDLVGNGSDCEFTVTVFDTRKGKGHRLDELKVLNLVEYNKVIGEDDLPEEAPKDVLREPVKKAARDLDDEIPF